MRPPGMSRPMPSSGSIAADSRVVPSASLSSAADARVAIAAQPRAEAPPQRAAQPPEVAAAPRRACHSHSLAAGAPASWRKNSRPLGDMRSFTLAVAVIVGPVDGSSYRSAPRTKNSRSPLPLKPCRGAG